MFSVFGLRAKGNCDASFWLCAIWFRTRSVPNRESRKCRAKKKQFLECRKRCESKVELKGDDDREEGEVEVVKTCYLLLKGSYLRKESRRPKLYVCHCRLPSLIPSLRGNNSDCNFCMLTQQKVVKPCRISSLHVKSNLEKTDYY